MKQAQKMQRQMEENQKELETKEFSAKAGGGTVEVTVNGNKEITKVRLDKDVVDPDDIEMLEDLIMAAGNEALRAAEDAKNEMTSSMMGGMGLGGGLPF
jgi:DNA-binding YbaB/EbfC family protein